MTALPPVQPQVIYLVERLAPQPSQVTDSLHKIKYIAGAALALLGLIMLFSASLALATSLAGMITATAEAIHPFFITAIACMVGGFHLTKSGSATPYTEISAGPITMTL